MGRKIKIIISIFIVSMFILSSVEFVDYNNSGNISVSYQTSSGKSNSGADNNTVNLCQNSIIKGNYKNCHPHQESNEITYDPANHYIYLSGYSSNYIYVINTSTDKIIKCISGVNSPQDILYDNYNHYLYVADLSNKNVSIINTLSNKVTGNIEVGCHPVALAYNNNTRELYVSNINCAQYNNIGGGFLCQGNITVINTINNKSVGNINVQHGPRNMYYDKYNNLLFVSNEYSHSISVIKGNNVIKNITLPGCCCAEDIVLDKSNNYLYAFESDGDVSIINTNNFNIVKSFYIHGNPWGAIYDKYNKIVYAISEFNSDIIELQNDSVITSIHGFSAPVSGVLGPRNTMYVSSSCSNYLSVVNISTNEIVNHIIIKAYPEKIAYDYKNNDSYITNLYANNVLVMNKNEKIIKKINVGKWPIGIAYDKFNNYIYVANSCSDYISIINATNNQNAGKININTTSVKIYFNNENKELYTFNYNSPNITLINTINNSITGKIALKKYPRFLTFDSRNNKTYVITSPNNASIYILNDKNQVIKTIKTNQTWFLGIVYDHKNNLIYISNSWASKLCIFNPDNNDFIGSVNIPTGVIYGVLLDTYNNYVYVMACSSIYAVNTSMDKEISSIGTGVPGSSGIYVNTTNTIYVVNSRSGTVTNIDPVSYNITFQFKNVNDKKSGFIPSFMIGNNFYQPKFCVYNYTVSETNGTYNYMICSSAKGINVKDPNGTIRVSGDNVKVIVNYRYFYPYAYYFLGVTIVSILFGLTVILYTVYKKKGPD